MTAPAQVLSCVLASDEVPADLVDYVIAHRLANAVTGAVLSNSHLSVEQVCNLAAIRDNLTGPALRHFVRNLARRGKAQEALRFAQATFPADFATSGHVLLLEEPLETVRFAQATFPEKFANATDQLEALRESIGEIGPSARVALARAQYRAILDTTNVADALIAAGALAIPGPERADVVAERLAHDVATPRTDALFLAAQSSDDLHIQIAAARSARHIADIAPIVTRWDQQWGRMTRAERQHIIATLRFVTLGPDLSPTPAELTTLVNLDLLTAVTTHIPGHWTRARTRIALELIVPVMAGQIKVSKRTVQRLHEPLQDTEAARVAARAWDALEREPAPGTEPLEQLLPTTARIRARTWTAADTAWTGPRLAELILAHLGDGPDRWATAHAALPADLSAVTVGEILTRIAATTQIG